MRVVPFSMGRMYSVSRKESMRVTTLICCVLALGLLGPACTLETAPVISATEDWLSVLVTEVEGGVTVEDLRSVDCIVYMRSAEGKQWFEVAAGESVTVAVARAFARTMVESIGGHSF